MKYKKGRFVFRPFLFVENSGKSDDLKRINEDHDNGNRSDVAQRAQP